MHNAHVNEKYVVLNKRSGVTPLHELTELKRTRPELRQTPLTYAGRLDPMASGKLLVLVGDECKKRSLYDGLDKEYEFELLLGVKSDTGDILGLASATGVHVDVSEDALTAALRSSVGVRVFPYPPFSSKTVQGKPLFEHALEGSLGDIEIPQIRSIIYKTELRGVRTVRGDVLLGEVVSRLSVLKESENTGTVHPDFRIGLYRHRGRGQLRQIETM